MPTSETLIQEQIAQLVKLYERTTQGRWHDWYMQFGDLSGFTISGDKSQGILVAVGHDGQNCSADVAFAAAAHNAMPALLETLAEKDAEIETLRSNYNLARDNRTEADRLLQQANERIAELKAALRDFADSPAEFEDARISYISVQVDRGALQTARELLEHNRND